VSHPDIVTLLATKDTNGCKYYHSNNDDCCQDTSGDTNHCCSANSEDASLSITIANTAVVNSGARNLLQIATFSGASGVGIGAKCHIAVGNVWSNQWVLSAVINRIFASLEGVALVAGARISVVTSDVGVDTAGVIVASVFGASIVVIAVQSDIEVNVFASASWIAVIVGAIVAIVASHSIVFACSSGQVARID